MTQSPTPEDFRRDRLGSLRLWVRQLKPNVPAKVPSSESDRRGRKKRSLRSMLYTAARREGFSVSITKHDEALWVMRLSKGENRAEV